MPIRFTPEGGPPGATRRVIEQFAHRPATPADTGEQLAVLTPREREVTRLIATGLSNEQIAAQLFISPFTAKTHVTRAISKLGVRDRAQLVILAYETGLVLAGGRQHPDQQASNGT
ncbi:hypothetical protein GCM10019017_20770 [Streptomyces showdoensis]